MLIEELRRRTQHRDPDLALVQGSQSLSYAALWQQVDRYTEILSSTDLRSGETIAVFSPNSIELAIFYLAIWQAGLVAYPFHRDRLHHLNQVLANHPALKAVLLYKSWLDKGLSQTLTQRYSLHFTLAASELVIYTQSTHPQSTLIEPSDRPSSTIAWLSSSGTTGQPKTVKLGARGTLANLKANAESLSLSQNDITLMYLPMSYSYGLIGQFLSHLYAGGTIVFPDDSYLIHQIPNLIQKAQITTLFTVPPLLRALLAIFSEIQHSATCLSSLRLLTIGGSAIDPFSLQRAAQILEQTEIAVTYGLSEAGPRVSTYFFRQNCRHIGSVGKPIQGIEIQIVDSTGNVLPPETEGEIIVLSPSVMQGYAFDFNDPKFIPEKLVYTGDQGYLSQDGYLYVLGRQLDLVQVKGSRVYLNKLKEVLYHHPDTLHVQITSQQTPFQEVKFHIQVFPKSGKVINLNDLNLLLQNRFAFLVENLVLEVSSRPKTFRLRK
jgi:long-chain acyl-CoA synthetase